MANRLAQESSPYLLQHQHNPVDWYAWGDEALALAQAENKPILLSIGYSACHWCHVMEHESFENAETARLMNEHFVSIKVDREERPDLDQIYQNVAQALTRSGGWPLTVFLTPDLRPFFGGTYFPPEDRYGRPGFPRLLTALANAFKNDQSSILENATRLTEFIRSLDTLPQGTHAKPSFESMGKVASSLVEKLDPVHGGMGGAPKFPNAMLFTFLWRYGVTAAYEPSRQAALLTLTRMASGGIYDQIGGGFHRYSVDDTWSVPHFEKMLYDNGLLLKLYSEVLCLNDSKATFLDPEEQSLYLNVVKDTVQYLIREMRSSEGGFFAAQDADSEGEEGKFFAWSAGDLDELTARGVLTAPEAQALTLYYGITEQGNFEHGKTVLFLARALRDVAALLGLRELETRELLLRARTKLFEARRTRVAPGTDHKILASWNGLTISGLAWAAQALRLHGELEASEQALEAARGAFDCVRVRMGREGGRLFSTLTDGIPKHNAYLDDYAFMAMAALDLARVSTNSSQVLALFEASREWIDTILKRFSGADGQGGGYFFTSDDHEKLIQRPKTVFDQAIPSGTAVALSCMAALSEMGSSYDGELPGQLERLFGLAERAPQGMGELLCASLMNLTGPVVVSGPGASELCRHPNVFQKAAIGPLLVCHQKACSLPLDSLESAWRVVREKLVRSSAGG